jgi:MFS family permease
MFSWFRTTIICSALLLEGMSSSSINVQVSAIREDLGLGSALLQLVVGAFLIAYAGLLPAAGRLVDAWSRRGVFLLGVALFGVGCAVCGVAPSGWSLVLGRFIQGAGAALSAPAALALITTGLPAGRRRNRALGLYAGMGAIGFSLGLVLPGFLVAELGWRASFLAFLPLVAVVILFTWTVRTTPEPTAERVDLFGAVLLTAVMMLAVSGIGSIGSAPGWVVASQIAAAAALALVVARRKGPATISAEVLGSRRVLAATVALAAVFAGIVTSMYIAALALQLRGSDAFAVGLALVPQSLANGAMSLAGARLVTRFRAHRVLAGGMLLLVAGLVYLGAGFHLPYAVGMLPAIVVIGTAVAMCYPAASIAAIDATPARLHGTAAGFLTTGQNLGGALGVAVATAIAVIPGPVGGPGPAPGIFASAVFVLLGGLAAALFVLRKPSGLREDLAMATTASTVTQGDFHDHHSTR